MGVDVLIQGASRCLKWAVSPDPRYRTYLAAIIIVTNISSLFSFGATFWIDSLVYVGLGSVMFSDLNSFYGVYGTHLYSHVGPGMSFVWALAQQLPIPLQWPVIAVFQHVFAGAALYFIFDVLNKWWPSRLLLGGCIAISFLPIYQAFQNSIMTESLSCSLLLIAISLCIEIAKSRALLLSQGVGLCLCLFFATQFRAYFGVTIAAIGMVAVALRISPGKQVLVVISLLVTFVFAELAFPLWRYSQSERWFLPGEGFNKLLAACWFNRNPSDAVLRTVEQNPLPAGMTWRRFIRDEASYGQICQILDAWIAAGLSKDEIDRRSQEIAKALISDRPDSFRARLASGLCSSGITSALYLMEPPNVARPLVSHEISHFRWLSWLNFDYSQERKDFFLTWDVKHIPLSRQSGLALNLALEEYTIDGIPGLWRNPLGLGWILPDVIALIGLVGLILIVISREWNVALIFGLPFFTNVAVTGLFPLASIRYCYPLLPIYVLAFTLSLIILARRFGCATLVCKE